MILEITCEVRERHTRIPRHETFTVAAESLEDVEELIAKRFPGKWCVHPKARVIDDGPSTQLVGLDEMLERFPIPRLTLAPEQFNRTADGIAMLERAGINIEDTERQFIAMKRKPGRPRKHG